MMKWLLILISVSAFTAPKEYLFCLGQEEKAIHSKKLGGARKYLVERMISETIQFGEYIKLNKRYLKTICESESPSLEILKLNLKDKNIFLSNVSKSDILNTTLANQNIADFKKQSIYVFIGFLSWIKNQNEDPKCFDKYLPELRSFYEKALYTLEEIGEDKVKESLGNIDKIFQKLKSYPRNLKKC